jgi:hypothetical protein
VVEEDRSGARAGQKHAPSGLQLVSSPEKVTAHTSTARQMSAAGRPDVERVASLRDGYDPVLHQDRLQAFHGMGTLCHLRR